MLVFTLEEGAPAPEPGHAAGMKALAEELASRGQLLRRVPLADASAGACVRVREGTALVKDGPYPGSADQVSGFWVVDVASRAEAIAIAARCPYARRGRVEVHPVASRYAFAHPGSGTPFVLAFRREPGLADPDGAKLREMIAFGEARAREGTLLETAPLGVDPPPARVETRGGRTLVTDGPFAETKEGVGGYSLVFVSGRAEAVDLAKRYPHARWGPVEVREVVEPL
jgi:hypothetical protein